MKPSSQVKAAHHVGFYIGVEAWGGSPGSPCGHRPGPAPDPVPEHAPSPEPEPLPDPEPEPAEIQAQRSSPC